ncbi:hypothetical protein SDC9_78769 [bioreactor metagenome]|uniref:Uncharacterized protein n=1 Tax=bioreactor metagenome TaxID=1076179 RepID=A0A644YV46_9ZZZZ
MAPEQILPVRDETQGASGPDELAARPGGPYAVDRHVVEATQAQLLGEPGDRHPLELGAQRRGEHGCRRGEPRSLPGTPGLLALTVVHGR